MNNFVLENLDDIRTFCLENISDFSRFSSELRGYDKYVPIAFRSFVWKVLKSNQILGLVTVDNEKLNRYMEEIKYMNEIKSSKISKESREEIWNFMTPIYKKLKEYSSISFKPTDLYLVMTNKGEIRDEVSKALRNSGVHSWASHIPPTKEKIWVEGDFPFSTFLERISSLNVPEEWWDFHQAPVPVISEE